MEIGFQYYYNYPEIKINLFNQIKRYKIELLIIIPKDIIEWEQGDAFLIKFKIINQDNNELNIKYPYVVYNDRIEKNGSKKWVLKKTIKTDFTIKDIPNSIDCSLNTYEHPNKRKWYLYNNYPFDSTEKYLKINWVDYKNYWYCYEYNFYLLYYRLICEIIYLEYNDLIRTFSFEEVKLIMNKILDYDNKYNYDTKIINEYHVNYLRDFLYLW